MSAAVPLLLTLAFACASPVAKDGDSLICAQHGEVRLLAIDAPELPGHCRRGRVCTPGDALASKAALARLLARGVVLCHPAGRDKYRRILARCSVAHGLQRLDLSCAQVAGGFAVERYGKLRCQPR